jgi:ATP-dependent RNA helicase RhlE
LKFTEFDLDPDLLDGIRALGFEETTPIQTEAIPIIHSGRDLIACAQTGTGKTAAFLIPVIDLLMEYPTEHTGALIIVPTRELARQIEQNVEALAYFTGISSVAVYGGNNKENWDRQIYGIKNGADIIIATPGRFLMHLSLGYVNLEQLEAVILDEADKMLDMGFYNDILSIISRAPDNCQKLMFSATMPNKIRKLAKEILKDPAEISLNLSKPAAGVKQSAYMLHEDQKIPMLQHLIKEKEVESMIIFSSSKISVDRITRSLQKLKYPVKAIHSDKEQEVRQQTLREFKNRQFNILVGTDVLARGIDIDNLSHVLNFDVPLDAEDYVHRVGRTARASSTGEAITFITPADQFRMVNIERLIEAEVPKPEVPEELGETPTYNPRSRGRGGYGRGGGGRSKGGDSRGKGRGGNRGNRPQGRGKDSDRRKGGGSKGQNQSRSQKPQANKNRSQSNDRPEGESKKTPSKSRKRRRPRPKKKPTGE